MARPTGVRLTWMAAIVSAGLAMAGCNRSTPATNANDGPSKPSSVAAAKMLAELPPGYAHADLDNGRLHFSLCRSCHTVVAGGPDMTGPNLYGVFGRKVASKPGFAFSAVLQSKTWAWDAERLNAWLEDPSGFAPGTKMTFVGLSDPKDRRDVIGYLKVASSGGAL